MWGIGTQGFTLGYFHFLPPGETAGGDRFDGGRTAGWAGEIGRFQVSEAGLRLPAYPRLAAWFAIALHR